MDMDRDNLTTNRTNMTYDRDPVYDRDRGGSNFLAFLIGGLVIAVGLLAFLFYDGGSVNEPATTGSTTQMERSTTAPAPATPSSPAPRPANPQ